MDKSTKSPTFMVTDLSRAAWLIACRVAPLVVTHDVEGFSQFHFRVDQRTNELLEAFDSAEPERVEMRRLLDEYAHAVHRSLRYRELARQGKFNFPPPQATHKRRARRPRPKNDGSVSS